jgi:hypothetical protein
VDQSTPEANPVTARPEAVLLVPFDEVPPMIGGALEVRMELSRLVPLVELVTGFDIILSIVPP